MNAFSQHCRIRTLLVRRHWELSSRLHGLTSRLMFFAVENRQQEFRSARAECRESKVEIAESWQQLQAHRAEHGC